MLDERMIQRTPLKSSPDLVFDDGVPEIVCKIAGGNHVPFVFRVSSGCRAFGQVLQPVLDPFESSDVGLMKVIICGESMIRTQINVSVV